MPKPFLEQCQEVIEVIMPRMIKNGLLKIRTETQGFTPIIPNKVQQHYHADRVARGFASHDAILKARKHGISTWKELEGLVLMLCIDGFSGLIMGDDREKTQKLFNIVRWAYDALPVEIKKDRQLDTDRRDAFAIGSSTLYIATSNAKDPARSDTLHWAHLTEVSRYANYDDIMSGITEAMAESGKSAHLCRESTPHGRNEFYDLCVNARDGNGIDKLYFYPWWWSDKYSLDLKQGERIVPTEEEKLIISIASQGGYQLTPEQLKWRRWKNSPTELGATDESEEAIFAEEYVEDPETCFLIGGSPIFKPSMLSLAAKQAASIWPIEKKLYPNGELIIWREVGKYPCLVSVDVAQGLSSGDWSVLSVWENRPDGMANLARMKIKCSPRDLAHYADELGYKYHTAMIMVEKNAIGGEVVRELLELNYPNHYYTMDANGMIGDDVGWVTSTRTKPAMLAMFKQEFESGALWIPDAELIEQLGNIQYDENGRMQTPKHKHDDIALAACMAVMGRDQCGYSEGGGITVVEYL